MANHVVNPSTKFEDPTAIRSWVMSSDISHRIALTGEGRSLAGKISGWRGRPPANILIPLEIQLNALQLCRWQFFYIMKLCSKLFVLHCRSRPKYDNSRHFDPHFDEVRCGIEPWSMAGWKARAEFLLSVIELLFLSLTVEALQRKTCQNSQPSGVVRSLWAKISGGRGRHWGIFFWFLQN